MNKHSIKWYLLLAILPLTIHATDSPPLSDAPKLFNLERCIRDSAHDCIKAACIDNSPTDCPTQCKGIAENKCHALAGQEGLRMN